MGGKVAFIGAGNMGGAILEKMCLVTDPSRITLYRPNREAAEKQSKMLGCGLSDTGADAVREAEYIFLCVKPQVLQDVLTDLLPSLAENKTNGGNPVIVSIAAGIRIERIDQILSGIEMTFPVVRIMPNTPVSVGKGILLMAGENLPLGECQEELEQLLSECGSLEWVSERELDLGSSITGCGPAFVYLFIEALADGGVQIGLSRKKAQDWASQMVAGAAEMVLQSGRHPGELKDEVCSPGGTTIAGVSELERHAFRFAVSEAVTATYEKNNSFSINCAEHYA